MKSEVRFVCLDGQSHCYAANIDLSYWSVRQWRTLWTDFSSFAQLNFGAKLVIQSLDYTPI